MNLNSLIMYIESLEPESKISLLIRIEKRILTRLLNRLTKIDPEQRNREFSDFWYYYFHLPASLKQGIGVTGIRDRARKSLQNGTGPQ